MYYGMNVVQITIDMQYALERLKVLCEEELCTNMTSENVSDVLALADLYNAQQLKIHAIDFVNRFFLHSFFFLHLFL